MDEEPVIGVDLDHTCWDTDEYVEHRSKTFGYKGDYSEVKTEYGAFDPDAFADLMDVTIEEVEETLSEAEQFIYNGVEEALQELPGKIVIVTRGLEDWQSTKVEKSGLMEYADDYKVVEGTLDEKPKTETDIDFLIDNRGKEIERDGLPDERKFQVDHPETDLQDAAEYVKRVLE